MSFTITCNQCGTNHDITTDKPKIIIDIANENFNDPESDYLLINCTKCHNTYEY